MMNVKTQNITLISTIHKEIGKCNADELCNIISKIQPEVIFLEALESTYSGYEHSLFSQYGLYHKKLEISAIQKYSQIRPFQYIPVLENELGKAFYERCDLVCDDLNYQRHLDIYNFLAAEDGFDFLNSTKSTEKQEELRHFERLILDGSELQKIADDDIQDYEDSMIRNIYAYCKEHQFNSAVFMVGVAHRKSLIKKISDYESKSELNLNWIFY